MAASGLAVASSATPQSLIKVESVSEAPAGSTGLSGHAVVQVAAGADPASVRKALTAASDVEAVFENIVYKISQGSCSPATFAAGVAVRPAGVDISWSGCYGGGVTGTALALFGERCGANRDQFNWLGMFAYNTTTGQLYRNCVQLRSATAAANVPALFGNCGVAPTALSGAPTAVCMETSSECQGGRASMLC